MDPIATLRELLYAILCEDGERAEELAQALHDWLERGGFSPLTAQSSASYEGWRNFQTAAVHRWLSGDEATNRECLLLARRASAAAATCGQVRARLWTVEQARKFLFVDYLKELIDSRSPLIDSTSIYADLLGSAIYAVDWQEIAEALLEKMPS